MYESYSQPLLGRAAFIRRVLWHALVALAVLGISLAVGMIGYAALAQMSWIDAFLNASMILGGMGPVNDLTNDGAKLFAGIYALYSGLVILAAAGLVIAPVLHRLMHSLHLDDDAKPGNGTGD